MYPHNNILDCSHLKFGDWMEYSLVGRRMPDSVGVESLEDPDRME